MADLPTYVLERVFDAPRELVWKTWTDPKLVPRWYGPGVKSIVHRLELKPGGLWLHEMQWGTNSKRERIEFTEVTPPQRLVWLQSAADADWNAASSPMTLDWPRVLLTTVTLEEVGSQTKLRLRGRSATILQPSHECEWRLPKLDRHVPRVVSGEQSRLGPSRRASQGGLLPSCSQTTGSQSL